MGERSKLSLPDWLGATSRRELGQRERERERGVGGGGGVREED